MLTSELTMCRLMQQAMDAFAQPHCSPHSQDACMTAVEAVLDGCSQEAAQQLLQPHAVHIVAGMHHLVQAKTTRTPAKRAAPAEQRMKVCQLVSAINLCPMLEPWGGTAP